METNTSEDITKVFSTGFKSYYVVWKRDRARLVPHLPRAFKSYYVVWKLEGYKAELWKEASFKSYYVVWKRFLRGEMFKSYYV